MKTLNKVLLAVGATSVLMTGANAALYNNSSTHNVLGYAGQPYVGLKVGQFSTDLKDSVYSNDKPTAYGVYGGYQFDPNWSAEAEYMGSDKADLKLGGTKVGQIKEQTFGAYGAYRYNFPNTNAYGKAKLGVAQAKVKADGAYVGSSFDYDHSKTSIAGGLGLGYNISPQFSVEAEYAFLPKVDDIKTDAWTIGAHMKF